LLNIKQFAFMPTIEATIMTEKKKIPSHIATNIIDFLRAMRTGHNTTPEDAKEYADLEIEVITRSEP